jgi:hypothetical protein
MDSMELGVIELDMSNGTADAGNGCTGFAGCINGLRWIGFFYQKYF